MTTTTETNKVRFLKHGVKDSNGKYFPCWYSRATLIGDTTPTVTLYAKSILKGLPRELQPENNSDCMTDYFESDKVRFAQGTPEYDEIVARGLHS
jgi:hypothetical protein